ncbi:MFS transporter [Amycolatopsis pittospori]|uniref:hypothetical protein n=1 Tax=Amycolatopsis pittospori TaxID=2749434 RepID=UPI001F2F4105|nr:hypothetical protein [Amycolatopsis pittospori]
MTGLPSLVYGVAESDPVSTIAGVVLLAAFVITASRSRDPLLDLRLFRDNGFSSAAAVIFGMGIALFGAMIVLPLYYLDVRQESLVATGLLTAPLALGTVAALPLALLTGTDDYRWLSLVQIVRGCGIGLTTTPALATGLLMVPREKISHAMPIFAMLQRIGASFGTSILTAIVSARLVAAPGTAAAIADAHWWIVGVTAIVVIPSWILVRTEARLRRGIRDTGRGTP